MKTLSFGVKDRSITKGKRTVTLGEIAIFNEYGTKKIPPRPAFREGIEHSVRANKKLIQAQLKNITRRILSGRKEDIKKSLTVMLTQIGRVAKAKTQEIIRSGSTTPNAPSTIARKGFDHPLYEKGLLLENVEYEVLDEN